MAPQLIEMTAPLNLSTLKLVALTAEVEFRPSNDGKLRISASTPEFWTVSDGQIEETGGVLAEALQRNINISATGDITNSVIIGSNISTIAGRSITRTVITGSTGLSLKNGRYYFGDNPLELPQAREKLLIEVPQGQSLEILSEYLANITLKAQLRAIEATVGRYSKLVIVDQATAGKICLEANRGGEIKAGSLHSDDSVEISVRGQGDRNSVIKIDALIAKNQVNLTAERLGKIEVGAVTGNEVVFEASKDTGAILCGTVVANSLKTTVSGGGEFTSTDISCNELAKFSAVGSGTKLTTGNVTALGVKIECQYALFFAGNIEAQDLVKLKGSGSNTKIELCDITARTVVLENRTGAVTKLSDLTATQQVTINISGSATQFSFVSLNSDSLVLSTETSAKIQGQSISARKTLELVAIGSSSRIESNDIRCDNVMTLECLRGGSLITNMVNAQTLNADLNGSSSLFKASKVQLKASSEFAVSTSGAIALDYLDADALKLSASQSGRIEVKRGGGAQSGSADAEFSGAITLPKGFEALLITERRSGKVKIG